MKLQKHLAYKYKDKQHYKHVVVLSENIIKELGWDTGEKLKQEVKGEALVIQPVKNPQTENDKKVLKNNEGET